MTAAAQGAAFWAFALATYERRGVRTLCLRLQDDRGLDVMVLLACLWAGQRGLRLDPAQVGALVAAVSPWQTRVTGRLRRARRAARKIGGDRIESGPLHSAILGAERAAERVTAELVAGVLAGALPAKPPEAAMALGMINLRLYCDHAGCPAEAVEADRQALARAAFTAN